MVWGKVRFHVNASKIRFVTTFGFFATLAIKTFAVQLGSYSAS